MSKHTPGPWHWDSDPIKGDPLEHVRYRVVTTGKTVTQCYYSSSDEQAEWDARLIAAAPELLEALILMVRTHDEPAESLLQEMKEQVWLDLARAAIAKATGQSDAQDPGAQP